MAGALSTGAGSPVQCLTCINIQLLDIKAYKLGTYTFWRNVSGSNDLEQGDFLIILKQQIFQTFNLLGEHFGNLCQPKEPFSTGFMSQYLQLLKEGDMILCVLHHIGP